MSFFKNTDLAKRLGVSDAAIHYWLKDAVDGKNNLEIVEINGKFKILDNLRNEEELQRLYQKGRENLKSEYKKNIIASPDFLNLFGDEELIEFISDLEKYEINLKFTYLNGGTYWWDKFYIAESSHLQSHSSWLTDKLFDWIHPYCFDNYQYNIFDIGSGNGLPIINFTKKLKKVNQLNKYYSIDISKNACELTKKNIQKEFLDIYNGELITDIENSTFGSYFYKQTDNKNHANLIFLLGGTINNIQERKRVFENIHAGMTKNDFFVFSFSLDNNKNRTQLNYVVNYESDRHQNWLPEKLGFEIDSSKNRVDYNPDENYKYKTFKVNKEYRITFPIFKQQKEVVIPQGVDITTWRHYLITESQIIEELKESGLEVSTLTKDLTGQTALVVCKTK